MNLHEKLKLVPQKIDLPKGEEIKENKERNYTFTRNYFLIKKEDETFITKEPLTMVQLVVFLKVSGLEEDRTLVLITNNQATSILSSIKKEEDVLNKEKTVLARKKKQETLKDKKEIKKDLPVEDKVSLNDKASKDKA